MKLLQMALITILAVFILSGCKQEITSTLFIGDLVEVVETDTPMTALSVVKLEMPSAEVCEDQKDALANILKPFFIGLDKIQCTTEGINNYYYATFGLPLVKLAETGEVTGGAATKYTGGIAVQVYLVEADFQLIGVALSMEPSHLDQLDRRLKSQFMGSSGIDPKELKIRIAINNDTRNRFNLRVDGCFLDGKAIAAGSKYDTLLERRSEAVIGLSDVSTFTLTGRGNKDHFAHLAWVAKTD